MPNVPVAWFYGLMAERCARFSPEASQVPFFQREITRFGQPALDLGCGLGRLLLPLLLASLDVDGCDISSDMLHHCRDSAASQGLQPRLYQQPMHAFDLPRQYRTIYICDAFNLAGSREKGLATLRCCFAHLQDGGALLLNIIAAYAWPEFWENCEPARRKTLPEPWPEESQRRLAADGAEYIERFRLVSVDPLEQSYVRQVHLEKWVAGQLVASEESTLSGNIYLRNEMLLMLQIAGFRQITVRGDYTDEPATPDSKELVFTAFK
ncbi:MAG: class I SAM-dependent methyltransferase [Chloroflexota bacterium]